MSKMKEIKRSPNKKGKKIEHPFMIGNTFSALRNITAALTFVDYHSEGKRDHKRTSGVVTESFGVL